MILAKNKKNKKKKDLQTIFFSVLIGVLLLGIISFLIISNFRISQKRSEMIEKIDNLKEEIENLESQRMALEQGIIQTQSETYWEERAREQGYKKPGEETVVIVPAEEKETKEIEEKTGFWQKILEKFGF